ncbi:cysteine proteinase [Xylaria sp. CBS 124048]|nr:cysteine proteinase [Xylaria sp. CBS 124048]
MASLEEAGAQMPADSEDQPIGNTARRSGRQKKVPLKYDEMYMIPEDKPVPSSSHPQQTERSDSPERLEKRPNEAAKPKKRKRRVAEVAQEQIIDEELASLQEEVFSSMDIDERKEYRGWVELESEPAFFNAMLQDLGSKDLKVQEVFSLDEMTLAALPKPVYGLVFLYEWTNEDELMGSRQNCPENLWFGNQTTMNACATVALMNIIMNIHAIKLGDELEEFREMTRAMPPPHRGHALDTNDFIRGIHNSVARRKDLLAEDMSLGNSFEERVKKRRIIPKKKRSSKSKNRDQGRGGYHYIAFVYVDGQVWELDGLESMPLCIGPPENDEGNGWLSVASQAIQRRMMHPDNEFLSFNLLAICQSPLLALSEKLATSLSTSKALDDLVSGGPTWNIPSPWDHFTDERLSIFNLSRNQILAQYPPAASFEAQVSDQSFNLAAAHDLAAKLHEEQEALEAEYFAEVTEVNEAVDMIRDRQRDYTPAVHQWVQILAQKGVLHGLIEEMANCGAG